MASAHPHAAGGTGALAIERDLRRMALARVGDTPLWPGYDPLGIPLAIHDGTHTYLFRHPSPPAEFRAATDDDGPFAVMEGRHPAVTANTSVEIGGVATATLFDVGASAASVRELAAIAVHEAFHVLQRRKHPEWIGNEADLFTWPVDSLDLLALRRLEFDALREALAAADSVRAACHARSALALRARRHARMDPAHVAYERGSELNEGLATYVEWRAAVRDSLLLPAAEYAPGEVRQRSYATGAAFAWLLDRFRPGWPPAFEATAGGALDQALADALGTGTACDADTAARERAVRRARADIRADQARRAAVARTFARRPGWRIVVITGPGEPLWPQGFDPLNLERIAGARVLHRRHLKLGNGAGEAEILGHEALTDGAGAHPIVEGIARLDVGGLARPQVTAADGRVELRTPGVTMRFEHAALREQGTTITIRLGR